MNCPICQFSGLSDDATICTNCKSDFSLLGDIHKASHQINKNNLILTLTFVVVAILIIITFFTLCDFGINSNEDNVIIEKLTNENNNLKNHIAELTLITEKLSQQQLTDTLETPQNDEKSVSITEYIVQKNDNLWKISEKVYGDGNNFRKIAKDNNIKKPYDILIGTKLIINKID